MYFIKKIKKVVLLSFALATLLSVTQQSFAAVPTTGRTWGYFNLTTLLSPNWAFVVMPGHRYEFSRSNDPNQSEIKTYFYELFAGPVYVTKLSKNLKLKLPLWYYYMGFDFANHNAKGAIGDYLYSHNIEFLPILEYKYKNFVFMNRVIFHNKIYAKNKIYDAADVNSGFSMLIREKFQITYILNKSLGFILADEIFIGAVEDSDTKKMPQGEPFFALQKFNKNRLYVGMFYKFTPFLSIVPQYVYETNYIPKEDYKLKDKHHYINVTLSYVLKLF